MAKNMFDKMRDGAEKMADDVKQKMEMKKAEHDAAKKKESEMKGDMPDKTTIL